jgi:hypothetical protein
VRSENEGSPEGCLAKVLALRPAAQTCEFTPAPGPAAVPQAPFRTLQVTNRLISKICVDRSRAETARRLQRVLKTNGDVPPIEHNRGCW